MITDQLLTGFAIGLLAGIVASLLVLLYYEHATRPRLKIMVDNQRFTGERKDRPPFEFYHLVVRNTNAFWPFLSRRPAWSCRVTLEVFDISGNRIISDTITGRWQSQPEPLIPTVVERENIFGIKEPRQENLIDPARLVAAQRVDIHQHEEQRFSVAIKYNDSPDCHIFSNESYSFERWQNPSWVIGQGEYRLRVTLYYEKGRERCDFRLINGGINRSNLIIQTWQRKSQRLVKIHKYFIKKANLKSKEGEK